jgi:cytochrome P450
MKQPVLDVDLYADEAIVDPYPLYREIRDLGPAVFLSVHNAWAIGRFEDVRAALRADEVLVSDQGVALNDLVNGQPAITTLTSDGNLHRRRRRVLMKPMMPSALAGIREQIDELADELVADLTERGSFDGIADFARHLPLSIVSRLVGLPEEGRQRMLAWAAASFNLLGPFNARAEAAVAPFVEMVEYATHVQPDGVRDGGWASLLYRAVEEGKLEEQEPAGLLIDYIAPSLDTTILGAGHMLFELGRNPQQWEKLRAEPERIPATVHEALRFEAPVRAFSRFAIADYDVDGTVIPEGDRVLILYASANRDERHFEDPDRFDITRDAKGHVAFGAGVHRCAGAHLAQLEMEALLRALVARVRTIDVATPVPLMNNVLRGYDSFEVTVT